MFIDTHAHLTSSQLYDHLDPILQRSCLHRIQKIVNICTDIETLNKGIEISKKNPWIYNAAATTPHDVEKEGSDFFPIVEKYAREKKLIAIGETGLDYHYEHSPRQLQQDFLIAYFDLALSTELPLIFHCREAFADLFALADVHYKHKPAVLHCFTGNLNEAKAVIEREWYLSMSGIVTFKKSDVLRDVIKYVPLDRLLIETDAPYLAPQSKRGQINEPSFLLETAEVIASLKGVSVEVLADVTSHNAEEFFSFSKVSRNV
jgi:TatD DNase family protein